ncbi:MAG TPA: guanylate kinase [Nevskiales bacterium]|nr:guanylate kinase [Nevskiales bacterium]
MSEHSPGRLIVIAAPSGAGKTSLTRALIERLAARGIRGEFSVSYTTRAPRPGERDGVDYHFVSPERFADMVAQDAFLEHAEVFGRRYGTGREVTERLLADGRLVFLDIDWQGARQVRTRKPDTLGIFIRPPSLAELERRLRARGQDDEATIARRMRAAEEELSHAGEFDHVLVNDDFERTLGLLEALVAPRA